MHRLVIALTGAIVLSAATAAEAQDVPSLCSDRPGKAVPSCVVDQGTIQIETSVADWTHDRTDGVRTDNFLFADTLAKYGIGYDTEVRVAFTPYIHDRTRDATGVSIGDGFGDVGLSARHRFVNGGDSGLSFAVEPFVTLPVGSRQVSAGTWSAGVVAPVDLPLPAGWSLNFTPTLAATADADGDGRHFLYSGVVAATHAITGTVSGTAEFFAQRNRDPAGHSTQLTADVLLAWHPSADWQFDGSAYVGLNRETPDIELLAGFTRRFR